MKIKLTALLGCLIIAGSIQAQHVLDTAKQKSIWDKRFVWGFTFNNVVMHIVGDNKPQQYFLKPGMGLTVRTEYYFHKNIGVSVGFGYQQKGSGIITPDYVSYQDNLGDGDSTHRARIKFNALELPLAVVIRSNEVIKGTRFTFSVGANPMKNVYSRFVMYSIEDGFHQIENHSDRYYKSDIPIAASVGIDINAGNSSIFQVHLMGNWGQKNVYRQDYFPGAVGKNNIYGIRLGWLF
jgi:hypothetical protein